jgi:hypothetical protein
MTKGLRINSPVEVEKVRILRTLRELESALGGGWGGSCVLQFYCSRSAILLQGGYAIIIGFWRWYERVCSLYW